jgi:hypothetical protein
MNIQSSENQKKRNYNKNKTKQKRFHLCLFHSYFIHNSPTFLHTFLPFEPTLFPKLQVYFADFPYSHCSTKLEVVSFGDLLRFLVRFTTRAYESIFSLERSSSHAGRSRPCLVAYLLRQSSWLCRHRVGAWVALQRYGEKITLPEATPLLYGIHISSPTNAQSLRVQEYEPASLSWSQLPKKLSSGFPQPLRTDWPLAVHHSQWNLLHYSLQARQLKFSLE